MSIRKESRRRRYGVVRRTSKRINTANLRTFARGGPRA